MCNSIKTVNYLGINLTMEVKDLYNKNYETAERNKRHNKQKNMYAYGLKEYC